MRKYQQISTQLFYNLRIWSTNLITIFAVSEHVEGNFKPFLGDQTSGVNADNVASINVPKEVTLAKYPFTVFSGTRLGNCFRTSLAKTSYNSTVSWRLNHSGWIDSVPKLRSRDIKSAYGTPPKARRAGECSSKFNSMRMSASTINLYRRHLLQVSIQLCSHIDIATYGEIPEWEFHLNTDDHDRCVQTVEAMKI